MLDLEFAMELSGFLPALSNIGKNISIGSVKRKSLLFVMDDFVLFLVLEYL